MEEGQNAQADLFVFEMVWIELKLSDENSSDEQNTGWMLRTALTETVK